MDTRSNNVLSEAEVMTDCQIELLKIKILDLISISPLCTTSIGTLKLSILYDNDTIRETTIHFGK